MYIHRRYSEVRGCGRCCCLVLLLNNWSVYTPEVYAQKQRQGLLFYVSAAAPAEMQQQVEPKKEAAAALLRQLGSLQQRLEDVSSKRRCLAAEADTYRVSASLFRCIGSS